MAHKSEAQLQSERQQIRKILLQLSDLAKQAAMFTGDNHDARIQTGKIKMLARSAQHLHNMVNLGGLGRRGK